MPSYTTLSQLTTASSLADANLTLITAGTTSQNASLLTLKNYVLAGTAATATKLATVRTINGVQFDGTANITIPFDISTGNAATATKLFTARTINGVSFDGTSNITIPITSLAFSNITSLPTSVSGYGIVDAVSLTGTQTLTNKTLTAPNISTITNTGTLTLPTSADTLVGRATSDTLTNKTISGGANTISNIANASLTNSSITINGITISLGGSATVGAVLANVLTIGDGISYTGASTYNGSTAVTIDLKTATDTQLGGVRILAVGTSGIINSTGTISLAVATTLQLGAVKVDGTSITATSPQGVITANAGGLSGTALKSTVVTSSLTSVGTLTALTVSGTTALTGNVSGNTATFTGTIVPGTGANTGYGVLTVTGCTAGQISWNQYIEGVGVADDTVVVVQLTGTSGGNGTYRVSVSQTIGPISMNVSAIYINSAIKLAEGHGIYQQDEHDLSLYNLLIGITTEEATVHIGDINTNGVSLTNNQEYKVESALNLGTYMAVAKVDSSDNVILASGNSATTQIRAGGITGADPYGIKIKNGGEVHIPYGMNIGSNQGNQAFGASLEINSDAAVDSTGGYAGISMVSYRTTDVNGPFGSFAYGARYRGTTSSPLAVANNDVIMEFGGLAWDGTLLNGGGEMLWAVDGTVAAGSTNPSRIEFYNTATNAKDQSLAMIIYATKKVQIYGDLDSTASTTTAFATPTTLNIHSKTTTATVNLATGVTESANTKTVNIGTGSASGSTTAIAIGSTTGTTITFAGDLVGAVTQNVFNTTSTTINEYGAATTINRGAAGVTEFIGKNTGNTTVSILGNTSAGTATVTTNVTSGTVNLFSGVTGTVNIGAVGSTTNFAGTLKQNGIDVPNLATMLAYQLAL